MESNRLALGLDIASRACWRTMLQRSRDRGHPVINEPTPLLHKSGIPSQVLMCVPVYRTGSATVAERRESLRGFVLAVLRVDEVIEQSIPVADREELYMHVADAGATIYDRVRHGHQFSVRRDVPVGDRTWTMTVTAPALFAAAHVGSPARLTLLIGVMLTLSVSLLVFYLAGQTARFAELVTARTQMLEESRNRAQQVARELEYQKRTMDEHAIVSVTDVRGTILYANDRFCEISGFSRDELIGENHRLVKSATHPREFYRDLWKTISRGDSWSGEIENQRKDGTTYWVMATIVPFRDADGKIEQYVAVRTDITTHKELDELVSAKLELERQKKETEETNAELRLANDALELSQAEATLATATKSEFLANMSHEIRTPMTAILGFAETMAENVESAANVEAISIIQKNGEHLLQIINDILDISKIEADKMGVEAIACDPCQLLEGIQRLMEPRAHEKGLAFGTEFVGDIPATIQTDPTRLRQILMNIIGNAIKFTDQGRIRLITSIGDVNGAPFMQFDVHDSGIGMTQDQVAGLFQPFAQADSSTTRKFGGTGLGLTISKRLARLLGGDIMVVDSVSGHGTCFRVVVAIGTIDGVEMIRDPRLAATATPTAKARGEVADLSGYRLLLAEDGPDNQRLIQYILSKVGATVVVVENGQLAVDAAIEAQREGRSFDCILMDMQMPVMSGYEATSRLRDQEYTGSIIALTAHAMKGDREKCLDAGCDDFANKPIDRVILINMVDRECQRSAAIARRM